MATVMALTSCGKMLVEVRILVAITETGASGEVTDTLDD